MLRKLRFSTISFSVILILSLTWGGRAGAETIPPIQPPIKLKASNVLTKELLAGIGYRVKETVWNDGLVNTYQVESDYEDLKVESTALLMQRINEIKALKQMEELKGTKVFQDAFTAAAKGPLDTAKGLVTSPVETVKGTVTGLGRWFSDVGRSVVSSDPHQEGALKTALGHAAAKRKFAYEFGVDPYSSFETLQKELNDIAWTATGGGLTVKAAFSAIKDKPGTVVSATSSAAGMRKLVRDNSPAELDKINRAKLIAMGVSETLVDEFLKNPHYNPQEETLLVGAMDSLKGVTGRNLFLGDAALAPEVSVALFIRLQAEMMANYHANVASVEKIVFANGVPFLQRKDGSVIGLFPLDYVVWTTSLMQKEQVVSEALAKLSGVTAKEIWLEGSFDAGTRKSFEDRGWKVKDRVAAKLIKQ